MTPLTQAKYSLNVLILFFRNNGFSCGLDITACEQILGVLDDIKITLEECASEVKTP